MNLDDHLDHFGARVLRDALNEATAGYWDQRAAAFEWARPRPGDYTGYASEMSLRAQDKRLAAAAAICREKAGAFRVAWGGEVA